MHFIPIQVIFQVLLAKLTASDMLVVTKLDRFARTAIDGVQTVRELFDRGVKVHILNMGLVENTLTGNLILTVMLAFAEYERGMIVERTQSAKMVLLFKAIAQEDMCSPQSGVDGGHPVAAIHQHADEVIDAFLVDLVHVLDFRQGVQEETYIAFVVEDGVGGKVLELAVPHEGIECI